MKHWPVIACVGVILLGLGLVVGRKFYEVKISSENRAIATHQIRAAAEQFFHENPERNSVTYDELICPTCYIKAVHSVSGEDYREMFPIPRGFRELAVTMGNGRRVIIFDRGYIIQDPDGEFRPEKNDPAALAEYRKWIAAGRPLNVDPAPAPGTSTP